MKSRPPRPLTPKEKTVLEFLEGFIRDNGISPSYQEICQHFGFASFNSVQRYLKQLETKGYVRVPGGNQKRALTVRRSASALQESVQEIQNRDALEAARNLHLQNGGMNTVSNVSSLATSLRKPSEVAQALREEALGRGGPSAKIRNVLPTTQDYQSENFQLPLLGRVAAGAPIEAYEHDEYIDVPASLVRHADRTYALRVQGQSMIEDGILDGDVILVQRQAHASNGEIVVAMIGEEATVKRFYTHVRDPREGKRPTDDERVRRPQKMIELRPANSEMESLWFSPEEVQLRGVVVGLIRKF